jgi:hypothetical protein
MESEVGAALELLLDQGALPTLDQVKALLAPRRQPVPELKPLEVNLREYDGLLAAQGEVA